MISKLGGPQFAQFGTQFGWGRMMGMSETRKKADWPIIAGVALAVLLTSLACYAVCYFILPETTNADNEWARVYKWEWQARLFEPAARVDALITNRNMDVYSWERMSLEISDSRPAPPDP